MLHYKACAKTRKQKAADIALMVFGLAAAFYTTIQTVKVRLLVLIHCVLLGADASVPCLAHVGTQGLAANRPVPQTVNSHRF